MMRELIVLLALSAGASWAGPSFFGPTGVLNTPTAAVVQPGSYNAFVNFVSSDSSDLTRYGANAGFGVSTPFEVGITRWDPELGDSRLVLNAKIVLPVQMKTPGSLSVGVVDITDEITQTPYVVYSREFAMGTGPQSRPVYGSIGFGSSNFDVLDGLFLSAATPIANNAWLMLEFDAEDFNAAARLRLSDTLSGDIGIVNNDLGLALAYTLVGK
jgi:hypothetical protein